MMNTKGTANRSKRRERDEVRYEQLILEMPQHRPPPRERPELDQERDRGVVTIELF